MTTMTPSQAAANFGVSAETLRYWERADILSPVGRDASGRRAYSDDDLESIDVIKCLRQTAMPIRAIREFVELAREGDGTAHARLEVLRAHRERVIEDLRRQQEALRYIERKISYYEGITL
ncbi:MerR family transcriptional regulator [Planctomonas sp. JC2975]|uniref:MerR family transcriptional regulator n=1 Tax=Planctomonas sp. JC2975 TaxID=2729626 RepID=UPI001475273F|nr:MerR family transcriptional regulator [Planctomonas sp. JC2975]NNC11440.1 MerR family transcriptional regulator [Planctomonas sp. JC2975]